MFWKKPSAINITEAGGTSGQITQANIKNFVVKAVGNVSEGADGQLTSSSYDLSEIKDAIAADSYLKLSVMKYSQLIFKAGYNILSDNDAAAEYVRARLRMMSFMTGIPIDVTFQQVAEDLVAYSNAFLVKSRVDMTNIGGLQAKGVLSQKPVGGYFRVDPATVQIKADKNGTIKQYSQEAGNNTTNFKPEDVIHIYIDKQGGELFGTPRIIAALEDVKLLRKIEGNILTLIYRFAIPLYQMKIGLPETGFMATDKEIDEAKKEVEKLANDGVLVTNERTQFLSVGAEGVALDATGYLNYFEHRVFSALNMSEAMMGRGGSKQDANSMEEQVHDAVKYYQHQLQIFFEDKIINELLLEGGYNPIVNESDIVHFQFEEINLETKVKMATHALNLFQGNAIQFEEMRGLLAMDTDSVDEARLHDNMIKQPNALDLVQAKLSATGENSNSASANTGTSGPSKSKTTNSTTKNIIQPQNQNGTSSVKIKESLTEKNIERWKKFFPEVHKKYKNARNDISSNNSKAKLILALTRDSIIKELKSNVDMKAQEGIIKALADLNQQNNLQKISMKLIDNKISRFATKIFKDINSRLKNCKTRQEKENVFDTLEYRLRFLCEHIAAKSYWFGYVKICEQVNVPKVFVNFGQSADSEEHKKIINPKSFELDDIPAFHAYCTCKIGLENTDKDGD